MKLSPTDKAAILLLALGEETTAEVFRHLQASEVRRIGAALGRLGRVDQATVDIVLQEFAALLQSTHSGLRTDGLAFAQKAIALAMKGEQAEQISRDIRLQAVRMQCLELAEVSVLARILQQEQPQTIALVLAHASPTMASALLKHWPPPARTDILLRLAKLQPVDPDIIAEIDQHILKEIELSGSVHRRKVGGPKAVASILNALHTEGAHLLDSLEERQPDLAQQIRDLMFTFDDLVLLDGRSMQELIKGIPRQQLALALRAAPEAVQQLFLRNMSERSAKILQDDIAALGPQKVSEVQKAQGEILAFVRTLEDEGRITIDREQRRVS